MIAVDTNILVHAHREDSPWHRTASAAMHTLARATWAIPWPCVHEFLAIVTHPRIFSPPTPLELARRAAGSWLDARGVRLLAEADGYFAILSDLLESSQVVGPRVHDARIAALCALHGVEELWTADRDFSRFARLKTRNPLLAGAT